MQLLTLFTDDEDKKTLERELFNHELIPQEPTYLSFADKFLELQLKMLLTNQENVQNHNYASDPTEWPFLTRGIAYFISKQSNVHFCPTCLLRKCNLILFFRPRFTS